MIPKEGWRFYGVWDLEGFRNEKLVTELFEVSGPSLQYISYIQCNGTLDWMMDPRIL